VATPASESARSCSCVLFSGWRASAAASRCFTRGSTRIGRIIAAVGWRQGNVEAKYRQKYYIARGLLTTVVISVPQVVVTLCTSTTNKHHGIMPTQSRCMSTGQSSGTVLPTAIRNTYLSLNSFRRELKTFYIRIAYLTSSHHIITWRRLKQASKGVCFWEIDLKLMLYNT